MCVCVFIVPLSNYVSGIPEVGLGSFWDCFGVVLGSFWYRSVIVLVSFWDRFGVVLGSFWDGFGLVVVTLWHRFGIVLESFLRSFWFRFGIVLAPFWYRPSQNVFSLLLAIMTWCSQYGGRNFWSKSHPAAAATLTPRKKAFGPMVDRRKKPEKCGKRHKIHNKQQQHQQQHQEEEEEEQQHQQQQQQKQTKIHKKECGRAPCARPHSLLLLLLCFCYALRVIFEPSSDDRPSGRRLSCAWSGGRQTPREKAKNT